MPTAFDAAVGLLPEDWQWRIGDDKTTTYTPLTEIPTGALRHLRRLGGYTIDGLTCAVLRLCLPAVQAEHLIGRWDGSILRLDGTYAPPFEWDAAFVQRLQSAGIPLIDGLELTETEGLPNPATPDEPPVKIVTVTAGEIAPWTEATGWKVGAPGAIFEHQWTAMSTFVLDQLVTGFFGGRPTRPSFDSQTEPSTDGTTSKPQRSAKGSTRKPRSRGARAASSTSPND